MKTLLLITFLFSTALFADDIDDLAHENIQTRQKAIAALTTGNNVEGIDLAAAYFNYPDIEVRLRLKEILRARYDAATKRAFPLEYFVCLLFENLESRSRTMYGHVDIAKIVRTTLSDRKTRTAFFDNFRNYERDRKKEKRRLDIEEAMAAPFLKSGLKFRALYSVPAEQPFVTAFYASRIDMGEMFIVELNEEGDISIRPSDGGPFILDIRALPEKFLVGNRVQRRGLPMGIPQYVGNIYRRDRHRYQLYSLGAPVGGASPQEIGERALRALGVDKTETRDIVHRAMLQVCPRLADF